jgi:Domain of unknown function (DUF4926)
MTTQIVLLDVVALIVDLPEHGLVRSQVGTVVEVLLPGVFEAEFADNQGGATDQFAYKVGGVSSNENPVRPRKPRHEATQTAEGNSRRFPKCAI